MVTMRTSESEAFFIIKKVRLVKTHVTSSDYDLLVRCSERDECCVAQVIRDAINYYLRNRGLKQ